MSQIPPGPKTILLNGVAVGEVDSTGDPDKDAEAVRQFLKSKGLHKETSQFQAIFSQAVSFATTSSYLFNRDLHGSPRSPASIVPFVVNAAFSIELYLKALAQKHGIALRGHKLVELHKRLPNVAHDEIESVIPWCAADCSLGEPPDFSAYLNTLNNCFVEWRYSYEIERTGPVYIEPTIFVMKVLHEACRIPAGQPQL